MGEGEREPNGAAVAYRLLAIERRLDRIEALEPAVMKAEIRDIRDDVRQIARDVTWVKRTMFAAVTTFSLTAIAVAATLISGGS